MLKRWLVESVDGWGRVMAPVSVALGVLAGLLLSSVVRLSDQQMTNAAYLAAAGGAIAFFVYLFFVAPFRLWYKAEKELQAYQRAKKSAPLAVHRGKGNQIINNFYSVDAAQLRSAMTGTSGGGPSGVAVYAPTSRTLAAPSHRPRGQAEVSSPQLSLPLPPPSAPRRPAPEESPET